MPLSKQRYIQAVGEASIEIQRQGDIQIAKEREKIDGKIGEYYSLFKAKFMSITNNDNNLNTGTPQPFNVLETI